MKTYTLSLIIIFSLWGCSNNNKKNETAKGLKSLLGTKISLSQDMLANLPGAKSHLFIYISEEDCVPCFIDKFSMFKVYEEDFKHFDTKLVFVVAGSDEEYIQEMFSELLNIDYTLFPDNGDFKTNNQNLLSNPLCSNFVVNSDKKVIWLGSPIQDEKSYKRFKEMMTLIYKKES